MKDRLRLGLIASRSLRQGSGSPLAGFLASFRPMLETAFDTRLVMPGATFDAVRATGILQGAGLALERVRPAAEGGLITLAARVVGAPDSEATLDWIVYLLDPIDQTSLYPEAQALKRQCVVHDRPFLSTAGAASEWCALEWHRAVRGGAPSSPSLAGLLDRWVHPDRLNQETVALIAHDRLKGELVAFAERHRPLLARFGRRVATGTTGALLNGQVPLRLRKEGAAPIAPATAAGEWVDAVQSGPLGGDAEIAEEVIEGRCRRVVFFEDPHVAREHEADIQLLERATRFAAEGCLCVNSPGVAERWAENLTALTGGT
jgi:methylglyoxal synthase